MSGATANAGSGSMAPETSSGTGPVADVADIQDTLRIAARSIAGFESEEELADSRSFLQVLRDEKLSPYPLIALTSLSMAQAMGTAGTGVLEPVVAESLGFDVNFFIILSLVAQIVGFIIPLATSILIKDHPVRAKVTIGAGLVWAVTVIWAGFVPTAAWWIAYRVLDTATSSAAGTVSGSLSMDLYPPKVRVRVFAFLFAGDHLAALIVPAFVLLLVSGFDMTWRGVYLVTGIVTALFTLFALGLRDPGYGVKDRDHLRTLIRNTLGDAGEDVNLDPPDRPHPSFTEVYRSLWAIKPMRFSIMGAAVAGLALPINLALSFFLANEVDFSPSDLALLGIVGSAASLVGLAVLAPIGDAWFRKSPRSVYWFAAALSVVGTASIALNVIFATKSVAFILVGFSSLAFSIIGPASAVGGMTVVPPEHRNYTGSIFQAALLTGTIFGTGLFAGANQQIGFGPAIIGLGMTTVIGAVLTGLMGESLLEAVDEGNERYIEEEMTQLRIANGFAPPILECNNVSASYGQVKALHDVNLSLREGEMLGMLGLNGSGKSTLLRVMAGAMFPDTGSVRFEGQQISFASPEQRVERGIVMMPGGQATFPSLTVAQNLELAIRGRGRRDRAQQMSEALDRFPALVPLINRKASLLSGGEQQMLGLARAFLLQPRLLLIDELSLGLAPLVVGQLMTHVRDINAAGTTVVLVEQSINVAVELVDRAVFLDRGVLRFDGPIEDLRARSDLLRAVFLREDLA
jgi:ABC-type branched-subunit amino acid transport system ATPase component